MAQRVKPPEDDAGESLIQISEEQVLHVLAEGDMEEQGLLPYSSNHSFLVTVAADDLILPGVYKPRRGESPLWDFAWGSLCLRETAAYHISQALGWDLAPPTVLRDGSRGVGSVQFFVANHEDEHYFTIQEDARYAETLRQLALFDHVINNADRKSGHCLVGLDGRLWAIDHGVCFHTDPKLRTVVWEYAGQPIDESLQADLTALLQAIGDEESALGQALCTLLTTAERETLAQRVRALLRSRTFPEPAHHRRNYPWPPV